MAPSTSFSHANESLPTTSDNSASDQGPHFVLSDLRDIMVQLIENNPDEVQGFDFTNDMQGGSGNTTGATLGSITCGIVDSVTLINCSPLVKDVSEEEVTEEEVVEGTTTGMGNLSLYHGRRRSGVRRGSNESKQGNFFCEYLVPTKKAKTG